MNRNSALLDRVRETLAAPVTEPVRAFAARLAQEIGEGPAGAQAALFYGSNLRTGSLDGVLDFYLLMDGLPERGIWPRVSYHEWTTPEGGPQGTKLRAKVATMTLATFAQASAGDLVDTTIWARFVQPSALVWGKDAAAGEAVAAALASAAITAARFAVALGPPAGSAEAYWRALFRATYRAEFRVERAGRENSILEVNAEHFAGLLPAALDAAGIAWTRQGEVLHPVLPAAEATRLRRAWARRRRLGKPYNLVRLIRASTTFEGAARYAAWKVERHTGVPVALTPWRERHPLLAAPGVLWRVWRARRAAERAS